MLTYVNSALRRGMIYFVPFPCPMLSAFFCTPSQVQLLHCIKQAKSEGGDNQFCDGFHIAERMRTEQPENFKLLTEVLIDHYDLGEESTGQRFFKLQRQPVIRCVSLSNGPRPLKSTGRHGQFLNSTCNIRLSDMRQGLKITMTWDIAFSTFDI